MTNEKKLYEEPKTEIVRFAQDDIVSTSSGNHLEPAELEEIED